MDYQQQIEDTSSFTSLVTKINDIFLSRNPVASTAMGLSRYNEFWPDISLEGILTDISILKIIQNKLSELQNTVENNDEADFSLLCWFVEFNLIELDELRYWSHNPRLSSVIISGFHNLIIKQQFSTQDKLLAINSRLAGISKLVKDFKKLKELNNVYFTTYKRF